jgi:hypothetical protein
VLLFSRFPWETKEQGGRGEEALFRRSKRTTTKRKDKKDRAMYLAFLLLVVTKFSTMIVAMKRMN